MTPKQVIYCVTKYEESFGKLAERKRYPGDRTDPDDLDCEAHLLWMCEQTKLFAEQDIEKAMRWLGFIQGVLWARCGVAIDEMRVDNTATGTPAP